MSDVIVLDDYKGNHFNPKCPGYY